MINCKFNIGKLIIGIYDVKKKIDKNNNINIFIKNCSKYKSFIKKNLYYIKIMNELNKNNITYILYMNKVDINDILTFTMIAISKYDSNFFILKSNLLLSKNKYYLILNENELKIKNMIGEWNKMGFYIELITNKIILVPLYKNITYTYIINILSLNNNIEIKTKKKMLKGILNFEGKNYYTVLYKNIIYGNEKTIEYFFKRFKLKQILVENYFIDSCIIANQLFYTDVKIYKKNIIKSQIYVKNLKNNNVVINVKGNCMNPIFIEGQKINIEKINPIKIKVGDIVLLLKYGNLYLHRVIVILKDKKKKKYYITKGDNSIFYDPLIKSEQIIGKMREIK